MEALETRMKENYESRYRIKLPRRTYTVIRIDGKAFHTYTRGLEKPFDYGLIRDMDFTAYSLLRKVQGCKLAYVQSDEISLVLTDFDSINTQAWFDGNLQKIASISASMATAIFNEARVEHALYSETEESAELPEFANFDSRAFIIPDVEEVLNYLVWRQRDAIRNSIQMVAQSLYSHKELIRKNGNELQEMCFQKGVNWNDYTSREKIGGFKVRHPNGKWEPVEKEVTKERDFFREILTNFGEDE